MKAEDGACAHPEAPYMPNIQTTKATDLTLNGPEKSATDDNVEMAH
jgi:hypothetical protein